MNDLKTEFFQISNSDGLMENQWSGPGKSRSRVKCFSKNLAPNPHAIEDAVLSIVWSENPKINSGKCLESVWNFNKLSHKWKIYKTNIKRFNSSY